MKKLRYLTVVVLMVLLSACETASQPPTYSGYVESEIRLIAAPQSGWIMRQDIQKGNEVAQDQLLFSLDDTAQKAQLDSAQQNVLASQSALSDLKKGARPEQIESLMAQLNAAQAQSDLANIEWLRMQSLSKKGLVSEDQIDKAKTDLEVAKSQVNKIKSDVNAAGLGARIDQLFKAEAIIKVAQAEAKYRQYQLSQRHIHSLLDGEIEDIFYHTGEYVIAGSPVVSIRLQQRNKVRFYVSQAELPALKLNQIISVNADGLAHGIEAKISFISVTAEFTPPVIYSNDSRQKLVFMIEARIMGKQQLHAGLPVDVAL